VLRALRPRLAEPGGADAALAAFCEACVALAEAGAAARPDLAPFRPVIARLCALARAELAAGKDDRPLLAALDALQAQPIAVPWPVAQLPGRVVFLACMVEQLPAEQAGAAAMLVNDLATLGLDLPRVALVVSTATFQAPFLPAARRCSMSRSSRAVSCAAGRSDFVTTSRSAISRMPALMACTSSPSPGGQATMRVSALQRGQTSGNARNRRAIRMASRSPLPPPGLRGQAAAITAPVSGNGARTAG
jgi:hypothetical protein